MKKNILFVVESLAGGGAEKVLTTLVKNLDKDKYNITLLTIVETGVYVDEVKRYCKVISALKDYNSLNSVNKFLYKIKAKIIYKINTKYIYKWLIKEEYDVEIAFVEGFSTKLISYSNNLKSKKYAWIHTNMITNPHADLQYESLEKQKKTYQVYDKIFAVSNDVKDSFIKKFDNNNVCVQYNPVDSNEIMIKASEKVIYDKNKLNLITIGRLEKPKGYDRLLGVAQKLKENGYNFNLYVIGEGSLKKEFDDYIGKKQLGDSVRLLGFKNNPYKYLADADLFICSSYSEGFSTVATEALILEIPIVTTDCAGMSELFGQYACGIITDNNENALYLGVKKVMDNPLLLKEYKKDIKIRKEYFSIEKRIEEIERILDE